jgi:hypothetical protein
MNPMKLYFDVRDIFRAPRLALSGKKIIIFMQANLVGYAVYWALNYLGAAIHGMALSDTWAAFGLYPCLLSLDSISGIACALYWIGAAFWFYAISLGATAVSRVTYKQLKGNEFYSGGDAWSYVKKHWHPIVFSSISLALILAFLFFLAAIFALVGKIPYVGEFLFVLPYLLYFFGSVFTIYTGIVFLVALVYTPAIVGTYEEDTMGTVWHNFSITWGQPWRIILYHAALVPVLVLGAYLFSHAWLSGYGLINAVYSHEWFMGSKLLNVVGWATQAVHPGALCSFLGNACSICSACYAGCASCGSLLSSSGVALTGTEQVAAFILAGFLFLLIVSAVSYTMAVLSVGETLMFIIFKKRSDDDNLLEKKDEEEIEEGKEDDNFSLNDDEYDEDSDTNIGDGEEGSENEADQDDSETEDNP